MRPKGWCGAPTCRGRVGLVLEHSGGDAVRLERLGMGQCRGEFAGTDELLALYAPMEEVLVEAGMVHGVQGLLAATALLGIGYPLIEGVTGASPGKWVLGLRIGHASGTAGDTALYVKRFAIKFIRPLLGALAGATGLGMLGWLAGPAGLVISLGTLLLLAPHRQALHDKLAVTAVFRRDAL